MSIKTGWKAEVGKQNGMKMRSRDRLIWVGWDIGFEWAFWCEPGKKTWVEGWMRGWVRGRVERLGERLGEGMGEIFHGRIDGRLSERWSERMGGRRGRYIIEPVLCLLFRHNVQQGQPVLSYNYPFTPRSTVQISTCRALLNTLSNFLLTCTDLHLKQKNFYADLTFITTAFSWCALGPPSLNPTITKIPNG